MGWRPSSSVADMTEREWDEQFVPLEAPNGTLMWAWNEIPQDIPNNRIWSLVDGEQGRMWVIAGAHVVNVFGFAVTVNPWTDENTQAPWGALRA